MEKTNIQLAVQNMANQTKKDASNDDKEEFKTQLKSIGEHIEDLVEINGRVRYSEKSEYYKNALASDKSSIRLDF